MNHQNTATSPLAGKRHTSTKQQRLEELTKLDDRTQLPFLAAKWNLTLPYLNRLWLKRHPDKKQNRKSKKRKKKSLQIDEGSERSGAEDDSGAIARSVGCDILYPAPHSCSHPPTHYPAGTHREMCVPPLWTDRSIQELSSSISPRNSTIASSLSTSSSSSSSSSSLSLPRPPPNLFIPLGLGDSRPPSSRHNTVFFGERGEGDSEQVLNFDGVWLELDLDSIGSGLSSPTTISSGLTSPTFSNSPEQEESNPSLFLRQNDLSSDQAQCFQPRGTENMFFGERGEIVDSKDIFNIDFSMLCNSSRPVFSQSSTCPQDQFSDTHSSDQTQIYRPVMEEFVARMARCPYTHGMIRLAQAQILNLLIGTYDDTTRAQGLEPDSTLVWLNVESVKQIVNHELKFLCPPAKFQLKAELVALWRRQLHDLPPEPPDPRTQMS